MAINNPIVTDSEWLQATAVAIQNKDGGSKIEVPDFASRVDALPTGGTLIPKTITENGVYNATDDDADGYDVVTVDVPEKNTLDEYFAGTLEVANIPSARSIRQQFFGWKSNLVNVIMPNVTSIGSSAFEGCTNLVNVIMPNVTSIDNSAFKSCTNLALTALPDGVTSIGTNAFQDCTNLALTALPDGVNGIYNYAFRHCTHLALTALPDRVTSIGNFAFGDCTNLALTALPDRVTSIGTFAFAACTNIPYLDFSDFTGIPTVTATSFSYTAFPFYFRDQQQLDEWAAATNWSTFASRFRIKPSGVI